MEFLCEKISICSAAVDIVGQTMKCKFVKCTQPRLERERGAKGSVIIALLKLRRNKWTDCWAIINRPPLGMLCAVQGRLIYVMLHWIFLGSFTFFHAPFVHLFGIEMHGSMWRYISVEIPKVLVPQGFIGVLWIYKELWKSVAEQQIEGLPEYHTINCL